MAIRSGNRLVYSSVCGSCDCKDLSVRLIVFLRELTESLNIHRRSPMTPFGFRRSHDADFCDCLHNGDCRCCGHYARRDFVTRRLRTPTPVPARRRDVDESSSTGRDSPPPTRGLQVLGIGKPFQRDTLFTWPVTGTHDQRPGRGPDEVGPPDFTEASSTVGRGRVNWKPVLRLQRQGGRPSTAGHGGNLPPDRTVRAQSVSHRTDTHSYPEALLARGLFRRLAGIPAWHRLSSHRP